MAQYHLVLGHFTSRTSLPDLNGTGYSVLQPGYYILLEKRDEQNNPLGWKLQSNRMATEQEAQATFEREIEK